MADGGDSQFDRIEGDPRDGEEDASGVYVTINRGLQLEDRQLFDEEAEDEEEQEGYDDDDDDDDYDKNRMAARQPRHKPGFRKVKSHPRECRCEDCWHPKGCYCVECTPSSSSPPPRRRSRGRAQRTMQYMKANSDAPPGIDMRQASYHRPPTAPSTLTTVGQMLLGLAVLFIAVYAYQRSASFFPEQLPRYQFPVRTPGYTLRASQELTEEEIKRGLMADVAVSRVLMDMQTHLRANANLTCICMHHLTGFAPGPLGDPFPSRRLCAVINQPSQEVDFMANPRATGQSKKGARYLERSLACDPVSSVPVEVVRPFDIWVEWDGLVADPRQPEGQRLMIYTRRLRGAQAACMALALDELKGEISCGKPASSSPPPTQEKNEV